MNRMLKFCVASVLLASLGGCAGFASRIAASGSVFGSTQGDYVVIKYSGGKITDVWKLRNTYVQSEDRSDGWLFLDNSGNPVHIGGDMKSIRFNTNSGEMDKYHEWHMDRDGGEYKP